MSANLQSSSSARRAPRFVGAALCALLSLSAGRALGQTNTGTTLGQFLLIEPSARVAGMGNAGVALGSGLEAVYYNPAALGQEDKPGVVLARGAWIGGLTHLNMAVSAPVGFGRIYAAVTSLTSGEMEVRTVEHPEGTGERFSASDVALSLGYGRMMSDRFAAGFQVNYSQENIWHSSVSALTVNFGTLFRTSEDGLRIGASLSNFGTKASYDGRDLRIVYDNDPGAHGDNGTLPGLVVTDAFPVPVLFRVGLAKPYAMGHGSRLLVEVDASHPRDNSESMNAGAELSIQNSLALRAGYQGLFLKDSEEGLTLGVGIRGVFQECHFHLDFAWADEGRLDSSQRFSLGANF